MVIDDNKSTSKLNNDIKKVIQTSKLDAHSKISLLVCLKYKLYSLEKIYDYIYLGNRLHTVTPNKHVYKVVNYPLKDGAGIHYQRGIKVKYISQNM